MLFNKMIGDGRLPQIKCIFNRIVIQITTGNFKLFIHHPIVNLEWKVCSKRCKLFGCQWINSKRFILISILRNIIIPQKISTIRVNSMGGNKIKCTQSNGVTSYLSAGIIYNFTMENFAWDLYRLGLGLFLWIRII